MENLHHRHTDRRSRKSSRRALCFLLWGCAVLCLPKPPPHHTPKLTAIEVVGAVRGAWKHTGAAVSHDPKAMASIAASSEADWNAMKMREKELAVVKIKAADVDIITNELELDPKVGERTLREHKGDAVAAIRHLLQ